MTRDLTPADFERLAAYVRCASDAAAASQLGLNVYAFAEWRRDVRLPGKGFGDRWAKARQAAAELRRARLLAGLAEVERARETLDNIEFRIRQALGSNGPAGGKGR